MKTKTLTRLAASIRVEHEAAERHARSAVEHAIRAGELLIEAKAQVAHGEWLPWLAENFPARPVTAQRYMRLAVNASRVTHLDEAESIREALAVLAEPKPKPTEVVNGSFTRDEARRALEPVRVLEVAPPSPEVLHVGTLDLARPKVAAPQRAIEVSRIDAIRSSMTLAARALEMLPEDITAEEIDQVAEDLARVIDLAAALSARRLNR
jgi:hypothetical protein